ncbi:MAG TPA: ATP-dependent endonuclease [Gaiellaceae bacterium]|nr:ATP-dependent endonuclease [Gaiellaceae bacterium]
MEPGLTSDGVQARTVVLVEGASDQRAIETLARRRGLDLNRESVAVVAMGGATNIRSFVRRFGPEGLDVKLAGLCDAGEERHFSRALEQAGLGSSLTRADLERLGFFICTEDLEDELIRALGTDAVERVIEAEGELGRFRTLQQQPAQQGRTVEQQLRRFMGTRGGRKIQYSSSLVEALDLDRAPRPLECLLAHLQR